MGETVVRDAVGRVLAALRDAGRAEDTVRSYRAVLEPFAVFLAERGLETASDRVCIEFVAEQTGVRLAWSREPVTDRRVRLVRRPVVLMADVLAGRSADADRLSVATCSGPGVDVGISANVATDDSGIVGQRSAAGVALVSHAAG